MRPAMKYRTARAWPRPQRYVRASPSARVPVTSRNRSLLRWLRAAQSSAWQSAEAKPRESIRIPLSRFSTEPLFQPSIKHL